MFFSKKKKSVDQVQPSNHALRFDMRLLKDNKKGFFLFPRKLRKLVTEDILSLNVFIEEANRICKVKGQLFKTKKLNFSTKANLVALKYEPLTATGKESKYHQEVLTNIWNVLGDNQPSSQPPFASLFYLNDGRIGKFRIVSWYAKHKCYVAFGKLIDDQLTLHKIEGTDSSGNRITIYQK
ncbi:MAG: hypothetical protein JJE17_04735 [Peptostreptococcaceae bacterium]|nr:hypothetical protein [Peptostreptococcaceae bacterium]